MATSWHDLFFRAVNAFFNISIALLLLCPGGENGESGLFYSFLVAKMHSSLQTTHQSSRRRLLGLSAVARPSFRANSWTIVGTTSIASQSFVEEGALQIREIVSDQLELNIQ